MITQEQKIEHLESENRLLKGKVRSLSSKIMTIQQETQHQAILLDGLENLLLDHGFKVVPIDE